jgi:hypothetical protein
VLDQLIHVASASGLDAALIVAGLLGLAGGLTAILMIRRPVPAVRPSAPAGAAAAAGAAAGAGAGAGAGAAEPAVVAD